jgi:hypothetical protein
MLIARGACSLTRGRIGGGKQKMVVVVVVVVIIIVVIVSECLKQWKHGDHDTNSNYQNYANNMRS